MHKTLLLLTLSATSLFAGSQMSKQRLKEKEIYEEYELLEQIPILPILPREVLEHIAQFLTFKDTEEEWEFMERLNTQCHQFIKPSFFKSLISDWYSVVTIYSPSGSLRAELLTSIENTHLHANDLFFLSTITTTSFKKSNTVCLDYFVSDSILPRYKALAQLPNKWDHIFALAISDHGYIAFLTRSYKRIQPTHCDLVFLEIDKLAEYEKKDLSSAPCIKLNDQLPRKYHRVSIEFNKQNTHIGIRYVTDKEETKFFIFELPQKIKNKNIPGKNIERWLQQQGVCKKFPQAGYIS